jgi:hypothetical protein
MICLLLSQEYSIYAHFIISFLHQTHIGKQSALTFKFPMKSYILNLLKTVSPKPNQEAFILRGRDIIKYLVPESISLDCERPLNTLTSR